MSALGPFTPADPAAAPEAAFAPGQIQIRDRSFATAFADAQAEFPAIPKNKVAKVRSERTGSQYEYHYADLADIIDAVRPVLARNNIAFSQPIHYRNEKPYVVTVLMYTNPETGLQVTHESEGLALPTQVEPQKLGGYLTYYRRYDACTLLGICAEEDDSNVVEPRRKSGRASGEGAAATDGPGDLNSGPPAPSGPPLTPQERKPFLDQIAPFKDIVGGDPLKRFILKHTGATDMKSVTAVGWNNVLEKLNSVPITDTTAVTALVNAD